jgi:RNA polymerase sigma-70 factor (ECF subfamily)
MIADVIPNAGQSSEYSLAPVIEAYEAQGSALIRFATMIVGPADAEDVVSEAVIRVLDAAETQSLSNPTAYLYRAVSNVAKNHRRSRSRRQLRERIVAPPVGGGVPVDLAPEVLAAVSQLSHQQRAVIFLTYWADLTPATIADYLDISEGSVRKQLARGRSKLAKVLHV